MATVDIELYYDLDRRRWTTSAGGLAAQPSLFIGQSNDIDFKVRFVQGGVPIELTAPSWIAGIKVTDDPLGDYLLLTTTGTQTGTGATTIYTFSLNIDSVELQAYLVGITPSTNSTAFEVRDTVNNIATLPAITCSILPDYTLTGATPAAGSGTLVVDSGATFTVHKSFAMPTDDGQNNYVLKTDGAGVGSWAVDSAGTGTVTSVAQSFTGGIVSVSGSPITTSGTLALTVSGTSGGIPYFSSGTAWATSGAMGAGALVVGGGAGASPTALAAVASGSVLTSAGTTTTPAYSSTITLGASGTLGTITLGNATSGTILITPPTGALGTPTLTLPITSTTLAGLAVTQAFSAANTFSLTTDATSSTAGGSVTISGGLAVAKKAFIGTLLDLVATTATAGQITQAGTRLLHTFGGTGNIWLGLTTGNTTGTLTGSNNVGIGTSAGKSMTTGANNMLIGSSSGEFITSGFNNVAVGISAGYNIGAGTYNTAIGYTALQFGGSGGYNTAIGVASLQNITSGTLNTCIGSDSGDDTSSVGGLTGANITSGASNTLIGALAASTSATGSFRTAIGSGARCQNNNAIKLGRDTLDVVILPSMTTDLRNAVSSPAAGSFIFNSTTNKLNFYNGTVWEEVTSA
jgi:hypothetical protein